MKKLSSPRLSGFTLLELLTVMAIIITLAGIVLAGVGFAQQKAARDRATAEIAALGVALESYKADNGDYPDFKADTDNDLAADQTDGGITAPAGVGGATVLYRKLGKKYFPFKADMTDKNSLTTSTYIIDPFGNPYGYSRQGARNPATMYDLWSTGGATGLTDAAQAKWLTNW